MSALLFYFFVILTVRQHALTSPVFRLYPIEEAWFRRTTLYRIRRGECESATSASSLLLLRERGPSRPTTGPLPIREVEVATVETRCRSPGLFPERGGGDSLPHTGPPYQLPRVGLFYTENYFWKLIRSLVKTRIVYGIVIYFYYRRTQ